MQFSRPRKSLRQLSAFVTTLTLVLTLLPPHPMRTAHAFMPGGTAALFLAGSLLSATHASITYRVVDAYDKELFGVTEPTKKMQDARDEIIDANMKVDSPSGPQFTKSASHFDGENFVGSQRRLKQYKQNIKTNMDRKRVKQARFFLGQALHTLQDFYSHSNWVELGRTEPNADLGNIAPARNPPATRRTCTDCKRDTCADCYDPKTNLTNLTTTEVTTGYYGGDDRRKPNAFKCDHGGRVHVPILGYRKDEGGSGELSDGINKDTRSCETSPHYDLHGKAATVAEAATKKYFDEVKELIGAPKMKQLLGGGPTLAFSVDTTGSMGRIITSVKQQITQIIDSRLGTDEEPSRYVLVAFNDPDVGPVTVTDDPEEFKSALGALQAGGGGDCPERSMSGMLRAVNEMDDGGDLMMFTDASSNDGHLTSAVSGLALSKDIKINPVAFGSCSPIDPGYIRLANETGGQIFVLSPSEAGNVTRLADFTLRANVVDLLTVSGSLTGAPRTYRVPVDSTMSSVTFSVSGTTGVVITRPDGAVVGPADPGVRAVSLSSASITSADSPAAGEWQVTINGSGDFSLRTLGESPLSFSSFDFVELAGRPLHEDYFPIAGLPPANQAHKFKAVVSSEAGTARFDLRAVDGAPVQTLSGVEAPRPSLDGDVAHPRPVSMPVREFLGDVSVPDTPFRAYVTGLDGNGLQYQRVISGVTKPQTVVVIPPASQDLLPGRTTSYVVRVKNLGPAGGFKLSATDDQGYVSGVSRSSVYLGAGEVAEVVVKLQPPADAEADTLDTLTFAAQGAGDTFEAASNYAVINSLVQPIPALDLGAVTAAPARGDGDEHIEPGESGMLSVRLVNTGSDAATAVSATLSTRTPGVTVTAGASAYPDLAPAGGAANLTPFTFSLSGAAGCGQFVEFELLVDSDDGGGEPVTHAFSVPTGQVSETAGGAAVSYAGPPVPIPDDNATGVDIPITVSGLSGIVEDLNFRIDGSACTSAVGATTVGIDHTYASDLVIKLTSPGGTTVTLIDQAGGSGNNFCGVLLDDQGGGDPVSFLGSFQAPFTGTHLPSNPLAGFNGENPNGTWVLNVSDAAGADVGSVRAFSLLFSTLTRTAECNAAPQGADLSVSTAASPGVVTTGSNVTYTTAVTNGGPGDAEAVKVETGLPAATTFVSCGATAGGVCGIEGGRHVVTFDRLPAGATATVTYVVGVNCPIADASMLPHTATVSSATADPDLGNNSATAQVVVSNPPPDITDVSVDKPELWPPNHKMVDVVVGYRVTDNCGPLTNTLSVTSNEPENGTGDGDTSPDWEVVNERRVRLRAERSGGGGGRIYTITVTSRDSAGNSSSRTVEVRVPHSRR